jgi:hypothetical protein
VRCEGLIGDEHHALFEFGDELVHVGVVGQVVVDGNVGDAGGFATFWM